MARGRVVEIGGITVALIPGDHGRRQVDEERGPPRGVRRGHADRRLVQLDRAIQHPRGRIPAVQLHKRAREIAQHGGTERVAGWTAAHDVLVRRHRGLEQLHAAVIEVPLEPERGKIGRGREGDVVVPLPRTQAFK